MTLGNLIMSSQFNVAKIYNTNRLFSEDGGGGAVGWDGGGIQFYWLIVSYMYASLSYNHSFYSHWKYM